MARIPIVQLPDDLHSIKIVEHKRITMYTNNFVFYCDLRRHFLRSGPFTQSGRCPNEIPTESQWCRMARYCEVHLSDCLVVVPTSIAECKVPHKLRTPLRQTSTLSMQPLPPKFHPSNHWSMLTARLVHRQKTCSLRLYRRSTET